MSKTWNRCAKIVSLSVDWELTVSCTDQNSVCVVYDKYQNTLVTIDENITECDIHGTCNSSTTYILTDQTVGINFYGADMLSIQLDLGRGIVVESCGLDILFSTDDPSFGSDAEHNWIDLSNTIDIEMGFDIWKFCSKRVQINQTLSLRLYWSNPSLVFVTQCLHSYHTPEVDTNFTCGYI